MSDGEEVVDSPFWTFEEDEEYSRDHSAFLDDSHHDSDISLEYEVLPPTPLILTSCERRQGQGHLHRGTNRG